MRAACDGVSGRAISQIDFPREGGHQNSDTHPSRLTSPVQTERVRADAPWLIAFLTTTMHSGTIWPGCCYVLLGHKALWARSGEP